MNELQHAREALSVIPPDLPRDQWVRIGMAAHAAGLGFDDFNAWSSGGSTYNPRDARDVWRSFKPDGGIGAGTLFEVAKQHGFRRPLNGRGSGPERAQETRAPKAQGLTPAQLLGRFQPARSHSYINAKQGLPDNLFTVPAGDPLRIMGESMAGALVVPVVDGGEIASLQFIAPAETAARLKARGKPTKLNLPGHPVKGWFCPAGELSASSTIYVVEGVGQAWAAWKATGRPAVVTFGAGRMRTVTASLKQRFPDAGLVLVPDVGKEQEAEKIAAELGAEWVRMPAGWPPNSDVNDLAQRDGFDALEALLASPLQLRRDPEPRRLDFRALSGQHPPPRQWFVEGWLGGPTLVAARGGMHKSTCTQHLATLGALGRPYFAPTAKAFATLIVNCEDDHDELWRRQDLICRQEGVNIGDLEGHLHIESRVGCDNALMVVTGGQLTPTKLMEQLRQQVNDLRIDVLVMDNVAHLLLADHDDRTVVTTFVNAICGLVRGRPFAPVLVAHVSRAIGSEFTGSVAWENAVRMRWFLGDRLPDQPIEPGDEDAQPSSVRFLCKRKSNYSAQDFVRFTVTDGGILVPDHEPQTVSGMVAMLDEKRADEVCVAGFQALKAMGLYPSDSKASPDYLPRQLIEKRLASGYSKADLARAMNRLMTAGKFTRGQVSQYSNRTPRMGLILADEPVAEVE